MANDTNNLPNCTLDVETGNANSISPDEAAQALVSPGEPDGPANEMTSLLLNRLITGQRKSFIKMLPHCTDIDEPCDDDQKTLLHIACERGDDQAADALLKAGADPNKTCKNGFTALHHSLANTDFRCVKRVLEDQRTDVTARCNRGNQALFMVASFLSWRIINKRAYLNAIRNLLEDPRVEANAPHYAGRTALHVALLGGNMEDRVRVILEAGKGKIDVDWQKAVLGRTLRDAVIHMFPSLSPLLLQRRMEGLESPDRHNQLLALVQHNKLSTVTEMLQADDLTDNSYVYREPYHCTLLHLACRVKGYDEFIPLFLERGANPNASNEWGDCPVLLAAEAVNVKAVEQLLKSDNVDVTVVNKYEATAMHLVTHSIDPSEDVKRDIVQILEALLDYKATAQNDEQGGTHLDVNAKDKYGDTPLHNAAYFNQEKALSLLLRNGGDWFSRNKNNDTVLDYVDPATLKGILDEQVTSNGLSYQSPNLKLTFKFDPIIPVKKEEREMDVITYINNKEDLKDLVAHPLISTFIFLKWEKVSIFFTLNLIFYCLLVMSLTVYAIVGNVCLKKNGNTSCTEKDGGVNETVAMAPDNLADMNGVQTDENVTTFPEMVETVINITNTTGCFKKYEIDPEAQWKLVWLRGLIAFFLAILIAREVTQLAILKFKYFYSKENILELSLIVGMLAILFILFLDERLCKYIISLSILLAWIDLIILTGKLRQFSLQLEMFKEVTKTFFGFFLWYSLTIIAFALSFYFLFHGKEPFYLNPGLSIFRVFLMFSGDLDVDMPFEKVNIMSHFIFFMFVVLVPIVLLNLLNGLAVYDTEKIKTKAHIYRLISLASLVSHVENFLEAIIIVFKICRLTTFQKRLEARLRIFNSEQLQREIHFSPGTRLIYFHLEGQTREKSYKMSRRAIREAVEIVNKRKKL